MKKLIVAWADNLHFSHGRMQKPYNGPKNWVWEIHQSILVHAAYAMQLAIVV